ncbi:MAG TPA: NAD(P)H-hydrate dehydratase [Dissulfurispiraceae bacterium]|nr:NAD(P)H-hydrate dehydratase [Dissulfurispiraceae bacterium]
MKIVTADEMRDIDRRTIEDYGIPGLVLMERAGLAVASRVRELFPTQKLVVLCGGGNNGGDGLVAARDLFNRGFKVSVIITAKKESLTSDCAVQYQIVKKMGIQTEFRNTLSEKDLHSSVVIDAVFGTGLGRPVKGDIARLFALLNSADAPVVAVDLPSGISSDTGEILGEAVMADCTVTFGLPKRAHFLYPGAGHTGKLFIEDIGFPTCLLEAESIKASLIDRETAFSLIPARPRNSFKGDYGHVLVIAGSRGKTGAALMCGRAALRSGSGLVTLGVPESLAESFQGRVTEAMVLPLPDDGNGMMSLKALDNILEFTAEKIDVIAAGPGIGVSPGTKKIMTELVLRSAVPMVVDADGLNSISASSKYLSQVTGLLQNAKSPIILTPHPGEMARLIHKPKVAERIGIPVSLASGSGSYVVLKGVPTIVALPEGKIFINTTGNPGMATAGTGDVLTGIIASLMGQGLNPAEAAALGVFIHGSAGDKAAAKSGECSLIASDLIDALPEAFMELQGCDRNA